MAGPVWAPFLIAAVAFIALALWLSLVFYADRHPNYEKGAMTGRHMTVGTDPHARIPAQSGKDLPASGDWINQDVASADTQVPVPRAEQEPVSRARR